MLDQTSFLESRGLTHDCFLLFLQRKPHSTSPSAAATSVIDAKAQTVASKMEVIRVVFIVVCDMGRIF
jgi:hypothetical protein